MGDLVNLAISNNMSKYGSERRYPRDILISNLKGKLELVTGVQCSWMDLELYNRENVLMHKLEDDRMLGYYSPENDWRLHVINKNPNHSVGEFDDLSKVEKFEISDEAYEKKEDSVRNFMMKNKIGKFSDDSEKAKEIAAQREKEEYEISKKLHVGDRCEVSVPKQPKRRGAVSFIGEVEFKAGCWVGVKFDEPLGKNDGSVQGKRYFTCPPKYGGFFRPSQVEVGDFPEEDLGLDDDDEM